MFVACSPGGGDSIPVTTGCYTQARIMTSASLNRLLQIQIYDGVTITKVLLGVSGKPIPLGKSVSLGTGIKSISQGACSIISRHY